MLTAEATMVSADLDLEQRLHVRPAPLRFSVSQVESRYDFALLEEEWNLLVSETRDEIFYRHEFLRAWIDNFAPGARLRILVARGDDGELLAALPLMWERIRLHGLPVRCLVSTSNDHSNRLDLIARPEYVERAAVAFLDHLKAQGDWDLLILKEVPEGGNAFHLFDRAIEEGLPTGTWDSQLTPYVQLPDSYDTLFAGLSSNFKPNLRRRLRRISERGQVDIERLTGGPELAVRLEEAFALEASGWKGAAGTAIAQDGEAWGFYTELARAAALKGELRLTFLRLDGKPLAFHYAVVCGGRYLFFKTGYEETMRDLSPGQLLTSHVMRICIEEGLAEFDFLGPDMGWKREWTDQARRHYWLFIFRDSLYGRLVRAAKFKWGRAARRVLHTARASVARLTRRTSVARQALKGKE